MIEAIYETRERCEETKAVMDFLAEFINDDEQEDSFFRAVRDTRLAGFAEGIKAALELFAEAR
jgi:hypothetical protein